MEFNVKIKNLGKLDDASIRIDRFTVLAGPNNSGKSFVSKTVYSIIKALSTNYVNQYCVELINELDADIGLGFRFKLLRDKEDSLRQNFRDELDELETFITDSKVDSSSEVSDFLLQIVNRIDTLIDIAENFNQYVDQAGDSEISNEIQDLINRLSDLNSDISEVSIEVFLERARAYALEQKFIDNFQVSHVSQLVREETKPLVVEIDGLAKIVYIDGKFTSELQEGWLQKFHRFSLVLYLESPIYLKLKNALDFVGRFPRYYRRRRPISQIPGYFHDLVNALEFELTGEIPFPELFEKLTSNDIMGGHLSIGKDGSIYFQENGQRFSLPITATGIANIGMLALLIERKILDNESFLFIDEPEAHLHPAWQVLIAETLFELARRGVHVVVATHSIEILKWLEVHVKKNPKDRKFIALNQFPKEEYPIFDSIEEDSFESELSKIKKKLAAPFAKLYIDGV